MFAIVARPLSRTTTRLTSTTASKRLLSSRSIDKKAEVNGDKEILVSHNNAMDLEPPSSAFLDVRIPPPEVHLEVPIQVPFVPDFWDSAKPIPNAYVTEVPKVVVVGGTETSHGSARSHTLEDINVPLESDSTQMYQSQRSGSFLDDIAEDLHLPPIQEIKNSFRKIFS